MKIAVVMAMVVLGASAQTAQAQTTMTSSWTGGYIGGSIGAGMVRKNATETVKFDTNLTGEYLFTSVMDEDDATVRSQGPAPVTNPFILVNAAGTDMQRSSPFEFQAVRVGLSFRF